MNEKFKKFNNYGGNIAFFILFSVFAFFSQGYMKFICAVVALMAVLLLIRQLQKNKSDLILYLIYLLGSIFLSGCGVSLYQEYWNNDAWLIAKIGFLIFIGAFFVGSIVFTIISLYLIIRCIRRKGNEQHTKEIDKS